MGVGGGRRIDGQVTRKQQKRKSAENAPDERFIGYRARARVCVCACDVRACVCMSVSLCVSASVCVSACVCVLFMKVKKT